MLKILLTGWLMLSIVNILPAQNLLPGTWKFKTGDDTAWAAVSFDDSGWNEIIPGTVWESQGYPGYDGFAWYRASVDIPAELRAVAEKYGGLSLKLGKIDDVDFTYFNGGLVGGMGTLPPDYVTKHNVERDYTIPFEKILWDRPNIIAVRVFDLYGGGGIYGFPIQLAIRGLSGKLVIEPAFTRPDCIIENTGEVSIPVRITNFSKQNISGDLHIRVISDFGSQVAEVNTSVTVNRKQEMPFTFNITGVHPGFYKAFLTFAGELAFKQQVFGFGYEPEKIASPPGPQDDFERYWNKARQELAAVDPEFKMIQIDSLCTSRRNVYLVEMKSLGNVLIRGWYSAPAKPGRYPAIMLVPGYSSNILPEYVDYGNEIIGFGLNIRGHGNSRDDIDPGFPGFLFYGIQNKETYIYRGAYMDCLRGIDFLYSRPEVDTSRVGVEGSSQGGALTFATAALDNKRIKACAPQVPFLSDFEDYFRITVWPGNEFLEYTEKELEMSLEEVYTVLSYIDIKNLAGWIKAPVMMGVGLVDDVCPPHINFAAYNQVSSKKKYLVYPTAGHGLPEDFWIQSMKFFREEFGLKEK